MQTVIVLTALSLIAAGSARGSDRPVLIEVALSSAYSLSLPAGTEAHSKGQTLIATLRSRDDAEAFGAAVGRVIGAGKDAEVVFLPTPKEPHRRIELGWIQNTPYADSINEMSRLKFVMHQGLMKQKFLGDLASKPGQHAAEASSITFHDKYRGTLYFSMSKLPEHVSFRLIFDIFRYGAMYSATFHWTQASITDGDVVMETIIDSVRVAE